LATLAYLVVPALAQDDPALTPGPATIALGKDLAELKLPKDFGYFDGTYTKKMLDAGGNHVEEQVLGAIVLPQEESSFMVLLRYDPMGYVKDDDAGEIDSAELLQSYKDGTEEQNEERKKKGVEPMTILGWGEEPHYDAKVHHLVWGLKAQSGKDPIVNYETRVLGREGVLEMTLVCDTKDLDRFRPKMNQLLDATTFKAGKRYADYKDGDKVSEAGILALLAGGAAAAKLGLFAKLGKGLIWLLVAGKKLIVVAIAAIGGLFKKLTGRGGSSPAATSAGAEPPSVGSSLEPAVQPPSEPPSEPPSFG
jgi:uncharacterized membrane-anchored protein